MLSWAGVPDPGARVYVHPLHASGIIPDYLYLYTLKIADLGLGRCSILTTTAQSTHSHYVLRCSNGDLAL